MDPLPHQLPVRALPERVLRQLARVVGNLGLQLLDGGRRAADVVDDRKAPLLGD
ncbi:hypothetical protein [Nonomuraea basaltis]|uniref:hypothetical protein n=1 Tax=Nonomuraea basaltis TaxID=2495887 RepID=UPI0014862306|nr:hypothetical protein [Nonomuraea basaltis]